MHVAYIILYPALGTQNRACAVSCQTAFARATEFSCNASRCAICNACNTRSLIICRTFFHLKIQIKIFTHLNTLLPFYLLLQTTFSFDCCCNCLYITSLNPSFLLHVILPSIYVIIYTEIITLFFID